MKALLRYFIYFLMVCTAKSYYFYNRHTKQVISLPTLANIPTGFRLINPPKTVNGYKGTFSNGLYCQDMGFTCTSPFDKSLTYQFECEDDSNCPGIYICCPQKCFTHKVCSPGTKIAPSPKRTIAIRPLYSNRITSTYSMATPYKCDFDEQCPAGQKCCEQVCSFHKVCSKVTYPQPLRIRPQKNEDIFETILYPNIESTSSSTEVTMPSTSGTTENLDEEEVTESREEQEGTQTTINLQKSTSEINTIVVEEVTKSSEEQAGTQTSINLQENTSEINTVSTATTLDPNAIQSDYTNEDDYEYEYEDNEDAD